MRNAVRTQPPTLVRAVVLPIAALLAVATLGMARAAAADTTVVSGPLTARLAHQPFRLAFEGAAGTVLADAPSADAATTGALGFRDARGWHQAVRVTETRQVAPGRAAHLLVATDDPADRTLELRVAPRGEGVIEVVARLRGEDPADAAVDALGAAWQARPDERYFGLGERANALEHGGSEVESYVSDGPYQQDEWEAIGALLPPPGFRRRADATYFPIPWLLSSAGYGVLVANDDTAYHRLGSERPDAWSFEVRGAPDGMAELPAPRTVSFLVFAGPRPADALRRFTRWSGRQPALAAPWAFGPWFQPGGSIDEQRAQVEALRAADAPLSVAQTYLHYLPCGSNRTREPERTSALHALGVAVTTYFNPMLCEEYEEAFRHAVRTRALVRRPDGEPYLYTYFTSRAFVVGQYDFGFVGGRRAFQQLLGLAVEDGHDGWMEDFGEYTPLDARMRDGTTGSAAHNRYVVDYHCAAWDFVRRQSRPIVRFQRSGWTGVSRCAQVVWGGDPTTNGWTWCARGGSSRRTPTSSRRSSSSSRASGTCSGPSG